jgi:tetratricopeptide (TPR) repeat protein/transcriptional regulator with XRE-family HTH domain
MLPVMITGDRAEALCFRVQVELIMMMSPERCTSWLGAGERVLPQQFGVLRSLDDPVARPARPLDKRRGRLHPRPDIRHQVVALGSIAFGFWKTRRSAGRDELEMLDQASSAPRAVVSTSAVSGSGMSSFWGLTRRQISQQTSEKSCCSAEKRGNDGNCRSARTEENPLIDRAHLRFGDLLKRHLAWGTWPGGTTKEPGRRWTAKSLAAKIGVSDRTVRYWLNNRHLPPEIETIERVLFGKNACYAAWRYELRQAYERRGAGVNNIPIRVPALFMGRDTVLADIAAEFDADKLPLAVSITALHGLRGVGKSTLAAAYAERHRGDYRAAWWIRAQAESSLRADLVMLGIRLGWVGTDDDEGPALKLVMEQLRQHGKGILLIYDNAIEAKRLKPYLPLGGEAHVLITSNAHAWRGVAVALQIDVWPKDIGGDFLTRRTGRTAEREEAEALSQALAGLPLAHEQAAAYCERLGIPLGVYLKRFAAAPTKFLGDSRHVPADYGLNVANTFTLAIEEAAKLHPAAQSLIVHAALLEAAPIPLFLFAEAREKFDEPLRSALADDGLDEAVAALRAFALVDRNTIFDERDGSTTADVISLHRLVREVAAQGIDQGRDRMRHALAAALATLYPDDAYSNSASWPRCRLLTPHLLSVCSHAMTDTALVLRCAELLNRAGSYFHSRDAYFAARPLFDRALAICEKELGPEHSDTATSLHNLALLLRAQGNPAAAQQFCERALTIRERALGSTHADTAQSLGTLASLHHDQGNFAGAQPLYKRTLGICETAFDPKRPDTATTLATNLGNFGDLLELQGDLAGAQLHYKRALKICETAVGPNHPDTASRLNDLAHLLQVEGDLVGAQPLHERALKIREQVLGPDHPDTAMSLSNLARLLSKTGEAARAEALFRRAIAIAERALGREHFLTQRYSSHCARLFLDMDRAADALPFAQAALATHEEISGPNHPWTKDSARVAADALTALDRGEEAAELRARYSIAP